MSLLTRISQIKNKYKDVEKITSATISTEILKERDDNNLSDSFGIFLQTNTTFKSLNIEYVGDIDILNFDRRLEITHSNNRISILNTSSINLDNSLVLEYRGSIKDFKKVVVSGFGQKQFLVSKSTPSSTSFNINNNENVVSSSDIKFYGGE